jgi:hypothetical protein
MSARRPRGGLCVTATSRAKRARVQNVCTYHTRSGIRNDGVEELWNLRRGGSRQRRKAAATRRVAFGRRADGAAAQALLPVLLGVSATEAHSQE